MCARYYPNGSNRPKKDNNLFRNDATIDDNGISRWLYESLSGNWTEKDQDRFERLYAIPGYKQYFDYLLDRKNRQEIFDLYGVDFTNVHDPRNVKGAQSAAALYHWGINFVSDNVKRLYR